ncbi:MAG: hypothetical protein R2746_05495 [Acidimicrobiales bacterium]
MGAAAGAAGAVAVALPVVGAGGALLFSPAAPTPAGAGNWASRSAAFRAATHP